MLALHAGHLDRRQVGQFLVVEGPANRLPGNESLSIGRQMFVAVNHPTVGGRTAAAVNIHFLPSRVMSVSPMPPSSSNVHVRSAPVAGIFPDHLHPAGASSRPE